MADWREGSERKPARKVQPERSKPASPERPQAAPVTPPASQDWRGRRGRTVGSSPQTSKEWMRGENAPVVIRGVRRRIFLLIAAIAIPLLTWVFIAWLFNSPQRVPVIVATPSEYSSSEYGEYPYSLTADQRFRETNSGNARFPHDQAAHSQALDSILFKDDWSKSYIADGFTERGGKLSGGGPNRNVIIVYLSGYVFTNRQGGQQRVQLVVPQGDPFDEKSIDRKPSINVEDAIGRVLAATDEAAKVWVTLDVRPAPISPILAICMSHYTQRYPLGFEGCPRNSKTGWSLHCPAKTQKRTGCPQN